MGFFEILVIAVVALFVVGPERMPEAVRSVALTIGRVKRSFNSARSELEKQIGTDDIRRQLHNESVMESLGQIKEGLSDIDKQIDSGEVDMPWTEDEYDYGPGHHHNDTAPDDEPETIAKPAADKPATDKPVKKAPAKKAPAKKATVKKAPAKKAAVKKAPAKKKPAPKKATKKKTVKDKPAASKNS